MKKILICFMLLCSILLLVNCNQQIAYSFKIIGENEVEEECSILLTTDKTFDETIKWSSSDESIAVVEDGIVYGKNTGEVIITAKTSNHNETKKITVKPSIIEVTIIGKTELTINEEYTFKCELSKETTKEILWSSTDESILSVNEDGTAKALKEGTVTISCKVGQNESHFEVNVTKEKENILIEGKTQVVAGGYITLTCNYECNWTTSDESIATIESNGKLRGLKVGEVIVTATDVNDPSNYFTFTVTVLPKTPTSIEIEGPNKMSLGSTYQLKVTTKPIYSTNDVIFDSSNELIISVDQNGYLIAQSIGTATITVYSALDKNIFRTITISVVEPTPTNIIISGKNNMKQGEYQYLEAEVIGQNVTKEVTYESSDNRICIVYNGIVLAVNKGTAIIKVKSIVDESIYDEITINVSKLDSMEISKEDEALAESILQNMTLSQKVGQMFTIGFSGTSLTNSLSSAIKDYNLGNVIYMGANVSNYSTLSKMSNDIQEVMIKNNGVAAFISTDQEGGRVARLTSGGTHFISNMAMAATNDFNNTYLQGEACGSELRHYGINVNFAPVLDVNNNPNNPIIGIRSYSDNPILVAMNGINMIKGLQNAKVMACSKHFPGHGNTSVDSHYGLPTITSTKDELYQTELAPFIASIANGIDSIMTTHIIFSAIDDAYPATLSKKVLTDLLRDELGYEGIIITDGMEMDAIAKYFGTIEEAAILAVKAGVDMLLYTSTGSPKRAHTAIVNAVNKGEISIDRINESVKRILLNKIKYDLIDNYEASTSDINVMLNDHQELSYKFAEESITLVKGNFDGLDKNKSTLIISPEASFSLGSNLSSNSFASYAKSYLEKNGYKNVKSYTVAKNISSSDSTTIINAAKSYDQIVVAMSNVKTSNYSRTVSFVNSLANLNKKLVVIALETPYDIMAYSSDVTTYICCYSYQEASCKALARYLSGEFEAKGVLPITAGLK